MRSCDKCGVGFSGALTRCPLCGNTLYGNPTPEAFPVQVTKTTSKLARRLLWILTLAAMIVVIVAGVTLKAQPWPLVFACVALLINYLFLRNVIVHSPDFLRITERWFLALLALCILWWFASSAPWLGSILIPSICISALVTNTVLIAVFRDAFVHGYAKYLLYDVALGFLPLIFVAIGWVNWPWLSYISVIAAVLLTLLLLLLTRKQLTSELRKLFTA